MLIMCWSCCSNFDSHRSLETTISPLWPFCVLQYSVRLCWVIHSLFIILKQWQCIQILYALNISLQQYSFAKNENKTKNYRIDHKICKVSLFAHFEVTFIVRISIATIRQMINVVILWQPLLALLEFTRYILPFRAMIDGIAVL